MTAGEDAVVLNRAKEKLARDELVLSMSIRLVRSIEIAAIVKTSGFDVLRIDLEHDAFSLDTTSQISMSALQVGITPFVRVPALSAEIITRVLDGGALGIIAPHIRSADDAKRAVEYAKYPPAGRPSAAGSLPHFEFRSLATAEANRRLNAATVVIALIESGEGLAKAAEIAAVEGIDILSIGTNDLCADLGITGQLDDRLVDEAYARVIDACRQAGKHCGVGGLASRPAQMAKYVQAGARYVSLANDLNLLMSAASDSARKAREFLG